VLIGAGWLFSPVFGIRWSTLLMASVIVATVGVAMRRPWVALAAVMAWVGVFEVVNGACNILTHHRWGELGSLGWLAAGIGGWAVLAARLGIWPERRWLLLTAVAFAAWMATGYDYNYHGQLKPLQVGPEIENLVAKTGLGIAYLAGALQSLRPSHAAHATTPMEATV
jgi:hypothetical protein